MSRITSPGKPTKIRAPKIKGGSPIGGGQMRGPGENLGLKKPRFGAMPGSGAVAKPLAKLAIGDLARQKSPTKGSQGVTGAYLPKFSKGGKVKK